MKRQTDRHTDRHRDEHISLTGTQWGPPEPNVGINSSRSCTPTLVILIVNVIIYSIKNIEYKYKNCKRLRTTGRTNEQTGGWTDVQTDVQMDGCMDGRVDRRTYRWIYYTATQGIWPRGLQLHALRAITSHANDLQKAIRVTGQRDRVTERRTYKPNWTPLGSSKPQCGVKYIVTLDPYTGNNNININHL